MKITFDRLREWSGRATPRADRRGANVFTVTYPKMLEDLERELLAVNATTIRLEADMEARSIRRDGFPYADARPIGHPGVMLSFDITEKGKQVRLSFGCDAYSIWWHNLRDIGLLLEDLRAVDRRRARSTRNSASGKSQYEGYTKTPIAIAPVETDPKRAAAIFLLGLSTLPPNEGNIAVMLMGRKSESASMLYKKLILEHHPDVTGDASKYTAIDQAAQLLGFK